MPTARDLQKSAGLVASPPVDHCAHGAHRQEHGESLPDLVVEAGLAGLVELDGVDLARSSSFSLVTPQEALPKPGYRHRLLLTPIQLYRATTAC